jgi:hypothetical protein
MDFSDDGMANTANWEHTKDKSAWGWQPLCEIKSKKS